MWFRRVNRVLLELTVCLQSSIVHFWRKSRFIPCEIGLYDGILKFGKTHFSLERVTKEKKKVRTLHKHTGLKQKKVTCPAGCPCLGSQHPRDLCLLFVKKKRINYSSEGQYLKEAHFFLKKAILLLSRAICFSISMEFIISCMYTCNVGRVFLILQVYI